MPDNQPTEPPPEAKGAPAAAPLSGAQAVRSVLDKAKEVKRPPADKGGNQKSNGGAGGTSADGAAGDGGRGRGGQRDRVLTLIDGIELWHDPDGRAWATFPIDGHRESWQLRSGRFKSLLAWRYGQAHGGAPGQRALEEAITALEGRALFEEPQHETFLRLGRHDGAIYLDLADPAWHAVKVTPDGWAVVDFPPVKFRRTRQMRPLPRPETGGAINDLFDFLNIATHGDGWLAVAWLVAAFRPEGPFPVLLIHGEQGSGKSTACRLLRELLDPVVAPIRAAPREERDLAVASGSNWCLAFDNLSGIPFWLSDAFCRVASGSGFGTRRLHSDDEEVVFAGARPIMLNGISELSERPDLTDRALILSLAPIPEGGRRPEQEFWEKFYAARPFILGAVLDILCAALREMPKIEFDTLPRMADFARLGVAIEHVLDWPEGSFLEAYQVNRDTGLAAMLEADPLALPIIALAAGGPWEGTATELLVKLESRVDERMIKSRAWPSNASQLGRRLPRLAPVLRARGIDIRSGNRQGADRARMIFITPREDFKA